MANHTAAESKRHHKTTARSKNQFETLSVIDIRHYVVEPEIACLKSLNAMLRVSDSSRTSNCRNTLLSARRCIPNVSATSSQSCQHVWSETLAYQPASSGILVMDTHAQGVTERHAWAEMMQRQTSTQRTQGVTEKPNGHERLFKGIMCEFVSFQKK